MTGFQVRPVEGLPEVQPGDDLAQLLALASPDLADGEIVVVTSKIVSKAEGRLVQDTDREASIDAETVRVVARRDSTRIVETRHGLVLAAAGVDASNTATGTVLLLPMDPDASARSIRHGIRERLGVDVVGGAGRLGRRACGRDGRRRCRAGRLGPGAGRRPWLGRCRGSHRVDQRPVRGGERSGKCARRIEWFRCGIARRIDVGVVGHVWHGPCGRQLERVGVGRCGRHARRGHERRDADGRRWRGRRR